MFYSIFKHTSYRFVLGHYLHEEIFFPVFRYFNKAVLQLLQRTSSILDVSVSKPKQETISLILPLTARNCARLCDLLAIRPFPQIAQKTLSSLHFTEREKITKMMIIFKTPAILVCFLRRNPIKPQTSVQRLAHTRNITTCCCKGYDCERGNFPKYEATVWQASENAAAIICLVESRVFYLGFKVYRSVG